MRDKLYYWPQEECSVSGSQLHGHGWIDGNDPIRLSNSNSRLRYVKSVLLWPDTRTIGHSRTLQIREMVLRF